MNFFCVLHDNPLIFNFIFMLYFKIDLIKLGNKEIK
jgi:hypothetical protein